MLNQREINRALQEANYSFSVEVVGKVKADQILFHKIWPIMKSLSKASSLVAKSFKKATLLIKKLKDYEELFE